MPTALVEQGPDAPLPTQRFNLRKALTLGLALLVGSSVAWYGHNWLINGRFIERTDDAAVGGEVDIVKTEVSGMVARIAVTDHQQVRAGDLLVSLDDSAYRTLLDQAEVHVDEQQATLGYLEAMRRLQNSAVADAKAGVAAAEAAAVRAHDDRNRLEMLSRTSAAAVQGLQAAEADDQMAEAEANKARAALVDARQPLVLIDHQKQQTEAALDAARAQRDGARSKLAQAEIRARVDGVVDFRGARVGAFVAAEAPLFAIVRPRGLWVDANYTQSQAAHIHPGLIATIQAASLPDITLQGRVVSLAPAGRTQAVETTNGRGGHVTVRILLDSSATAFAQVRPGLPVTARVDLRDPG